MTTKHIEKVLSSHIAEYKLVKENKPFKFKNLCPYCGGDLTYIANGWDQEDDGTWTAESFDIECSTEPEMGTEEWDDWMNNHSDMPYVNQLPVDERVRKWIKERYRFDVK